MEITILIIALLIVGIFINPIIQNLSNSGIKKHSSNQPFTEKQTKELKKLSVDDYSRSESIRSLVDKILELNNLTNVKIELLIFLHFPYQIQDGQNQRDFFRNDYKLISNKVLVLLSNCKYLFFDQDIRNHLETIDSNKYVRMQYNFYDISDIKAMSIHSNKRDHEIDSICIEFEKSKRITFDKLTFKGEDELSYVLEKNVFYSERIKDWYPGLYVDNTDKIIDKFNEILTRCK